MKQKLLLVVVACFALFSCKDEHSNLPDGLYADIETVKGHIIVSLEFEKTPVTVANFVSLAEGKNPFVSTNLKGKNFYDGLKFHRVEPGFVIQGGDPDGNGGGGPGYRFKNEITDLKHDQAGTLSMANAGPGTNGSQFFITLDATPHLDGRHTVFGYVVDGGMTAVNKIVKDDGIISVKIIRKGDKAKKFDAVKVFSDYFNVEVQNEKKAAAKQKTILDGYRAQIVTTASGLQYAIVTKGSGKKPAAGSRVSLNYAGYFENGSMFDSNIADVARAFGKYDQQRDEQGGYAPMQVPYGQKIGMIPGFLEGINLLTLGEKVVLYIPASLAYGEAGAGNVIPPNTNLIFELELLDKPQ